MPALRHSPLIAETQQAPSVLDRAFELTASPVAAKHRRLRILHATRAPVGGIFRHILDVANGQIERGHEVGIITDSLTGGTRADDALAEIAPRLSLGVHRLPIHREPHPSDLLVGSRFMALTRRLAPDVLHGHGAKAGTFVRLKSASSSMIRIYTPHGGSLHYSPDTLKGKVYGAVEAAMKDRTELFLFESAFARDTYQRVIGVPSGLVRCVFNGVSASEFDPIVPADDATDLAYVGEFRLIKGADVLIDAVALLHRDGRPVTLTLGGDGEEMGTLRAQVVRLGLSKSIRFSGHVKARDGFARGRLLVVPSRGDSMPYVVIEAAAAGVPMIAANVGGIPEVFGNHNDALFESGSAPALANAISEALQHPEVAMSRAAALRARVFQHFSQRAMVDGIISAYAEAFTRR